MHLETQNLGFQGTCARTEFLTLKWYKAVFLQVSKVIHLFRKATHISTKFYDHYLTIGYAWLSTYLEKDKDILRFEGLS